MCPQDRCNGGGRTSGGGRQVCTPDRCNRGRELLEEYVRCVSQTGVTGGELLEEYVRCVSQTGVTGGGENYWRSTSGVSQTGVTGED